MPNKKNTTHQPRSHVNATDPLPSPTMGIALSQESKKQVKPGDTTDNMISLGDSSK